MNFTFHRVAAGCGLRLSYYTTSALLALAFLGLVATDYRTPSPLYILFSSALLPSLIRSIFFSGQKEKRENLEFPLFCKKYHYEPVAHKSMNLAYLLLIILLAAWYISYHSNTTAPAFITSLPALIAAVGLLTRFLGTVGFRLYFRFFPLKAMR